MSGHMVEVEIVGVGAYIAPASGGRRRPYRTGAIVEVTEEVAERLIEDGVARVAGQSEAEEGHDGADTSDTSSGGSSEGAGGTGASEEGSQESDLEALTLDQLFDLVEKEELELDEDLDDDDKDAVIAAIKEAREAQAEAVEPLEFNPTDVSIPNMLAWAEENGLELPDDLDTSRRDPVISAIEAEVAKHNEAGEE